MAQPVRPQLRRHCGWKRWRAAGLVVCVAFLAHAVSAAAVSDSPSEPKLTEPARNWALEALNNEVLLIQHPDSYLRYKYHVVDEKGDQTRDQIETPEGSVARVVQRDGRPLTAEEDAAERSRLSAILQDPSGFARHIKREQDNKKMGVRLIRQMADAFVWSYTSGQPQKSTWPATSGDLVVIDFKPNPKWSPPDMEAATLTGVEGRAWIDPHSKNLVYLEATLTHAVNIGWGMVAHIYPGGTAKVDQANAGGNRWIVQHIVERITVRALLVKTINQRLQFDTFDYQAVKAMSVPEAVKLLLDTPLPQR
jgi:hypothetical protein